MRKFLPFIVIGLVVIIIGFVLLQRKPAMTTPATTSKTPPAPVNQIPIENRPYVVLQPLTGRNEVQITIHEPKIAASTVEVALEYDRNKGVLDAVLKQFRLSTYPYQDTLFLGSKSAGGHITYHDDVIGGKITLTFDGGEKRYALESPWRYDDTQSNYTMLSTADGKFQVELASPLKSAKVITMLSPGLPATVEGQVIAGPYLFRGVGSLPSGNVNLKIRLSEDTPEAKLFGWDGSAWQTVAATIEGKTLSASSAIYDAYVVTK